MSYQEHTYYLKRAIEISRHSREAGNTPFGALLVDEDGNILMEQENIEITEKSVQDMRKLHLRQELPMNTQENFWANVLFIQLQSPVPCVQVQFTGQISDVWYME